MDITDEFWKEYLWAKEAADTEDSLDPERRPDYREYLPSDPTHPRAWIPSYVRWAKRSAAGFRCLITGWYETDYFQDVNGSGPVRLVGRLTADHIIPGSIGGTTCDDNIQMVCELANTKKGNSSITNDALRDRLLSTHKKVDIPDDLLEMLRKYKITQYRIGNAFARFRK